MSDVGSPARCGYTWPENHSIDDAPNQQSCCYRETVLNSDQCIWHTNSKEVGGKTVEMLQSSLTSIDIREQSSQLGELLDGAVLTGLDLGDEISLKSTSLRNANLIEVNLEKCDLNSANLSGAKIWDADLKNTDINHSDFTDAKLNRSNLSGANGTGAIFINTHLIGTDLSDAFLWGANFQSSDLGGATLANAVLSMSNLSSAYLGNSDSRAGIDRYADLSNIDLSNTDLTDAILDGANLSDANLSNANLSQVSASNTELAHADLKQADLSNSNFRGADLNRAILREAEVSGADLSYAYLSDVNLSHAHLFGANLEQSVLVRTNLFNSNLTNCKPHGATFTDVQINDSTILCSKKARRWNRGPLQWIFPELPRCGYDPRIRENESQEFDLRESLGKAADTYQTYENLARNNARPTLQSSMFILRQDMQRRRHWLNGEYLEWIFALVSRVLFKYGESLARIFIWAMTVILIYGAVYSRYDLIIDAEGTFITDPIDSIYFSTLVFTTLGLGGFQPDPVSEIARALVTSQAAIGAIIIAIFVFVLGRRAAR